MAYEIKLFNDPNKTGTILFDGQEVGRISQNVGSTLFAKQTGYYDKIAGNTKGNNPTMDIVFKDPNIKAISGGKVISAQDTKGWGGQVKVQGNDGRVYQYSHLRSFNVKPGDVISSGSILGLMGGGASDQMKGTSTGRHLDLGVLEDGKFIDPTPFLTGVSETAKQVVGQRARTSINDIASELKRRMKANPSLRQKLLQKMSQYGLTTKKTTTPTTTPQTGGEDMFSKITGSIITQESGGNYNAVGPAIPNRADRALGKYQIMGANIPSWSQRYLGRQVSNDEFLGSPQIQDQIATGKLKELYDSAIQKGLQGDDVARYVATSWYAGQGTADKRVSNGKFVYTDYDLNPQAIVGGSAPSIKRYGDEILNRINK